jgi:hypothetical protein
MASRALKIEPEQIEPRSVTSQRLNESVQPAVSGNKDEKEIAALAYLLWQERGRPTGSDQEDWFRAERELARLKGAENITEESPAAEEAAAPRLRFPDRAEVDFRRRNPLERMIS